MLIQINSETKGLRVKENAAAEARIGSIASNIHESGIGFVRRSKI